MALIGRLSPGLSRGQRAAFAGDRAAPSASGARAFRLRSWAVANRRAGETVEAAMDRAPAHLKG